MKAELLHRGIHGCRLLTASFPTTAVGGPFTPESLKEPKVGARAGKGRQAFSKP